MSNRPKKHHFVPVGYLKFFCRDGTLHEGILRPSDDSQIKLTWTEGRTPESVAYQKNLNTLLDNSAMPFQLEADVLARTVDDPCIREIRAILEKKPNVIPRNQSSLLIRFIAYQAVRVPAAMRFKGALDPYIRRGEIVGDFPNNPGPSGIFEDAETIGKELETFTWHIEYFDGRPGTNLITSDRPVGLYCLAEQDGPNLLQPSTENSSLPDNWIKEVICTFPLAKDCAALGFRGPKRKLTEVLRDQLMLRSRRELASWINAMTAFQVNHVYSCCREVEFLLPNALIASSRPAKNRTGSLEDFYPLVDAFMAASSVKWPPHRIQTTHTHPRPICQ